MHCRDVRRGIEARNEMGGGRPRIYYENAKVQYAPGVPPNDQYKKSDQTSKNFTLVEAAAENVCGDPAEDRQVGNWETNHEQEPALQRAASSTAAPPITGGVPFSLLALTCFRAGVGAQMFVENFRARYVVLSKIMHDESIVYRTTFTGPSEPDVGG